MRESRRHAPRRNRPLAGVVLAAMVTTVLLTWGPGCAPNDPFDPNSVENRRPVVAFFVGPVAPNDSLRATSYYDRSFAWSGTDADGFVTEFYVSIRENSDVPAPWVTTTRTDTTMTFNTGDTGQIDAAFLIACVDDRGAYSDTLFEIVSMRNFPPLVGFLSDFDPQKNLQREFRDANGEVTGDGSAAADTIYWNWGDISFDLFASDPDGRETMDDFYRYTLATEIPDSTYDIDDPRADPETAWVKVPFEGSGESVEFRINLADLVPGDKLLTVSVKDAANSDSWFQYPWTVRAPAGPVLYIPDASSSVTRGFYENYLNQKFGEGNWDKYVFWKGFPEDPSILLASMRKFDAVIWTDSGAASLNLKSASVKGGLLAQYVKPTDGSPAGNLFLISRILTGTGTALSNPFLQEIMGVSPTGAPPSQLRMQPGKLALGEQPHLVSATSTRTSNDSGVGLKMLADFDNEILYRMEECRECYGDPRRPQPPFDPIVGMRMPSRGDGSTFASLVGISLQFDEFVATEVHAVLDVIFTEEFGVSW